MKPVHALWLTHAYAYATGLALIVLAARKALRGTRVAWLSVLGVSLALVSLSSLGWIASRHGAVPVAVHAVAAVSSMIYVAIMGYALWMRYAFAVELKQVLAQGPSFDPVTRLPSHAHAGKLVGSFLRVGAAPALGVIAVSLANLESLERLHGRAAYNHALYVSATRLRRGTPMGAQLGRLGEDGFLVLLPTDDVDLLKHVASKVRAALIQPIEVGADPDAAEVQATSVWVADVGLGITLRKGEDSAGRAVATARATSRAAFATPGRIIYPQAPEPAEPVNPPPASP
jgi:GGDEF domain-containing protein